MKSKTETVGEFLGHLAVGAIMFVALLLFGGALNTLVHWVTPLIHDESFVMLMTGVEKALLYGDVVFIVWWVLYSTWKAIKDTMGE